MKHWRISAFNAQNQASIINTMFIKIKLTTVQRLRLIYLLNSILYCYIYTYILYIIKRPLSWDDGRSLRGNMRHH